jgi:dimethylglycine dehydrogenase
MKSQAQVLIIGGGVVGCSVLYHLASLGCTEVVLCERRELTAGSSWHAAGGFHALNSDINVSRLQAYTISVYREIERLSGQDVGLHFTGGLNVAATKERWEFLRADWARHKVLGLSTELISATQVRQLCPLMDTSEVLGALYDPMEGHLDPSGATHAYAKAAQARGAEVSRQCRVMNLTRTKRGTWLAVTTKGEIEAEHVVNAAGLWAREVAALVGVRLPLVPMEHHYLLTDDLPELSTLTRELPLVLDLDGGIYLRQERRGVLLGVYEPDATPWALSGTPWDYGESELLAPQLERLTGALERGFRRFPALSEAGIRRIVNGPFTFTPDGNPLVGPVPGVPNYWAACGVMAGFAQGGGVGLALAQWILRGEPDSDIYAMDVARFGPYAGKHYTVAKAREFYARRFQIAYPNEYWPAGRPARVSAVHERLRGANAVFGVSYGLEVPLFFAPPGTEPRERPGLRRSNAFAAVGEECTAARNTLGIIDISSFGKYEVSGERAPVMLDRLLAGQLPEPGRIRLTPMLGQSGRLMGDLITMRLSHDRFLITGSGYLQTWHMRWFAEHLAGPGVCVRNVSDELPGLAFFGPRSRSLLEQLTQTSCSNEELPFMSLRELDLAFAPAWVARLSVTGELGYEVHVPSPYLGPLLEAVLATARDMDGQLVGLYALNSLRLEKGYGIWSREYSRDYTPRMAGLDRFIDYDKPEFVGRDAALKARERDPPQRLVTIAVDAVDADATGYEPLWREEELVGFTTSGGYGHCAKVSLAMGYLRQDVSDDTPLSVTIAGERRTARALKEPAIDPAGTRMRR